MRTGGASVALAAAASRHLGAFVAVGFVAVVLAFSPLTLSLDDLKAPLLLVFGGIALVGALLVTGARWTADQRAMAAWLAVATASAAVAEQPWIAWPEMARRVAAFGLFLGAARWASAPRGAAAALRVLLVVLAVEVLFSLWHQLGGFRLAMHAMAIDPAAPRHTLLEQMVLTFAGAPDLLGTILNVDFYSGYLAAMAPLALAGMLVARTTPGRAACLALVVLCVQGLAVTLSKESLAALGAGLGVAGGGVALLLGRNGDGVAAPRPAAGRARWLAAGAVIVLAILAGALLLPRARSVVATLPVALRSRTVIWEGAVGAWREAPLLGSGPGGFRVAYSRHRPPDYYLHGINNVTLHAHSLYLDALAETGAAGLVAMLVFLGAWGTAGLRAARRADAAPGARVAALGFLGAGMAMAVQDVSSPWSRWPVGMAIEAMVWGVGSGLFAGLARRVAEGVEPPDAPEGGLRRPARIAAGVAALAALAMALHGFVAFRASVAYHRGYQAFADGDPAAALRGFGRALALDPHHASALYWLAGTHLDAGRSLGADGVAHLEAAVAAYDRLDALWPLYSEAEYNRSLAEDELATHALARALQATHARDTTTAARELLAARDHFERAAAAARRFRATSDRLIAARQLGDVLRREGRFLARYGEVLPAAPPAAERFAEAAAVYRAALGAPPDADELARGAVSAESRQQMRRHLTDLLRDLGRPDEALPVARAAYAASPDNDDDAVRLVELLLLDLARPIEAAKEAERVLADVPIAPARLYAAMRATFLAGADARVRAHHARLAAVLERLDDEELRAAYGEPAAALVARLDAAPTSAPSPSRPSGAPFRP